MDRLILGLSGDQWNDIGISVLILVAVLLLGRWIISFLLDRIILRIIKRTKSSLDDLILDAVRLPIFLLAIVLALDYALNRLDFIPQDQNLLINESFFVLYFLVVFILFWRLVTNIFTWLEEEVAHKTESTLDDQLFPFFRRISLILLSTIGLITILSHFDVNITAMVTTLGIGSLAIALAAQNTLEDTINGFMIMIDRPYRIGDRIQLLDIDTWGDVEDIGLRSTRIRTRDNRMVIVPNSQIGKSLVVNYTYPNDQYRIEIHLGIAYGSDIEKARNVMVQAVESVEGVLKDKPVEALFLEFGDSAMIFRVRWWLESYVDTRRMFDRVNTSLYQALDEANIDMPFNQLDVNLKKE
jgi:small-conductance mechanosensitive channel